MIKIGQRWRRIGAGFNTGSNQDVFIVEVVELQGGSSIKGKVVQDSKYNKRGDMRDCFGLPTAANSNEYWMLLEGQDSP